MFRGPFPPSPPRCLVVVGTVYSNIRRSAFVVCYLSLYRRSRKTVRISENVETNIRQVHKSRGDPPLPLRAFRQRLSHRVSVRQRHDGASEFDRGGRTCAYRHRFRLGRVFDQRSARVINFKKQVEGRWRTLPSTASPPVPNGIASAPPRSTALAGLALMDLCGKSRSTSSISTL